MKVSYHLSIFLIAFITFSCSHSIHQVHVGDFSETYQSLSKGKMIASEAEQFVILGFTDNTNYVDEALQNLMIKCPKGNIQGISTEHLTSHGFFSWTNTIKMQGLCLK